MTVAQERAGVDAVAIQESSPAYPGWRVVAACFVLAVYSWGFCFYGHGFYLAELQAAHGWPASVIAGATTVFYLFSAVLSAFVGDAIDRFGGRPVVLAGLALTCAAAMLVPAVSDPWQLYAAYALMAFGWAATSLTAITTILGIWFEDRRGLAISIGLTGASFGGILIVPLLTFADGLYGFQTAMSAVAAGLGVLCAATVAMCLRGAPPFASAPPAARSATPARGRTTLLRSAAFWSVSGPFALAFFAQVGFLVHQIALLEPSTGRATAGVAVAATTAAAVAGRLALGVFIDRLDRRTAAAASFASQAAALAVIHGAHDPALLIAACAVFGFSVGNVITLPALIVGREFSRRDFAIVVGLSNAVCQIAYSFGPAALGLLRDATGGYGAPLILCVALDLVAAIAIVLRPRSGASGDVDGAERLG